MKNKFISGMVSLIKNNNQLINPEGFMETFNKLISFSRTTEVNAVSGRIIFEYDKNDWSTDLYLTSIFDLLKAENAILTSAINRIKAESVLEECTI